MSINYTEIKEKLDGLVKKTVTVESEKFSCCGQLRTFGIVYYVGKIRFICRDVKSIKTIKDEVFIELKDYSSKI